jgi:hypothetical protein
MTKDGLEIAAREGKGRKEGKSNEHTEATENVAVQRQVTHSLSQSRLLCVLGVLLRRFPLICRQYHYGVLIRHHQGKNESRLPKKRAKITDLSSIFGPKKQPNLVVFPSKRRF